MALSMQFIEKITERIEYGEHVLGKRIDALEKALQLNATMSVAAEYSVGDVRREAGCVYRCVGVNGPGYKSHWRLIHG